MEGTRCTVLLASLSSCVTVEAFHRDKPFHQDAETLPQVLPLPGVTGIYVTRRFFSLLCHKGFTKANNEVIKANLPQLMLFCSVMYLSFHSGPVLQRYGCSVDSSLPPILYYGDACFVVTETTP